MRASGREKNHVMAQSGLAIHLAQCGHLQSGDEAAVEMLPGGLLGIEPDDEFFFGFDGGIVGVVARRNPAGPRDGRT